jgi:hypothetical protein
VSPEGLNGLWCVGLAAPDGTTLLSKVVGKVSVSDIENLPPGTLHGAE